MVTWDAVETFPDGTHAAINATPAGTEFFNQLHRVAALGNVLAMTTLPLAEPGRAIILCLIDA